MRKGYLAMPMSARKTAAITGALVFVLCISGSGCSSFSSPRWMRSIGKTTRNALNDNEDLRLTPEERAKRLAEAREHYLTGDQNFNAGSKAPRGEGKSAFLKAAKAFSKAANAHPGSAIAQDAQFMTAESYFFADHLARAEKAYGILQKEYPSSRHNDRAAARQFAIAQYWIETEKAGGTKYMPFNLVDKKRPWFDIDGHGIRVLDQIRFDDPTGRLADDATMAAAVEHFRQGNYLEADEFLTDLRETFTDSEHLFNAHLLGIRAKMEMYAGPMYSRLVLDEADKLIAQTRQRFPDKMQDPEINETIAQASAEVDFRLAEKVATRAEYREFRGENGAARMHYEALLANHEQTPFAEKAKERLPELEGKPALPERHLAFLTKIFPEGRRAKPLVTAESTSMFR